MSHVTTAEFWKGYTCGIEGTGSEKKINNQKTKESFKASLRSTALHHTFYIFTYFMYFAC